MDTNTLMENYLIQARITRKYINTFDFKTLYTQIPHDKLKENLKTFISSVFNFKNKCYINIAYNSAQFSDKPYKHGSFNEKDFCKSHIISNRQLLHCI